MCYNKDIDARLARAIVNRKIGGAPFGAIQEWDLSQKFSVRIPTDR